MDSDLIYPKFIKSQGNSLFLRRDNSAPKIHNTNTKLNPLKINSNSSQSIQSENKKLAKSQFSHNQKPILGIRNTDYSSE